MDKTTIAALILVLSLALRVEAAPAPIVFDFEDGLQGWELHGAAARVQTQVLGGEWAIFGDTSVARSTSIHIEIDLGGIAAISWTQLYIGPDDRTTFLAVIFQTSRGAVLPAISFPGPDANPGTRRFDILRGTDFPFDGPAIVEIRWIPPSPPRESQFGHSDGLIDNITFHPVPEPSTLALLAFSLGAILIARQRVR